MNKYILIVILCDVKNNNKSLNSNLMKNMWTGLEGNVLERFVCVTNGNINMWNRLEINLLEWSLI